MTELKRRGHPRFYALLDEAAALHDRKNADYAADKDPLSNLKLSEQFGVPAWIGALIRISDKFSRITQLSTRDKQQGYVKDESIVDTLKDMAIYSLLAIVLYEEEQQKKMQSLLKKRHR